MFRRSRTALLVGVVVLPALGGTGFAQGLVAFDPPNSDPRRGGCASSINDGGQVAGYFGDPSVLPIHGFVRARDGNYTVFDAGANGDTEASSINNGGTISGTFDTHGFVRDPNGNITLFDAANSFRTITTAMNAGGDIAGNTLIGGQEHAFVRDRSGIITVFDAPNATLTVANGINDDGYVVGEFADASHAGRSFVRDPSGVLTIFDPPPNSLWAFKSINNAGQIAGWLLVSSQVEGFVRDARGVFTTFRVPNSDIWDVTQINDRGEVLGEFVDHSTGAGGGFVRHSNGDISVFQVPTATFTNAFSINTDGEVAGCFGDTNRLFHEFVRGKRAQIVTANALSRDASGNIVVQLGLVNTGELAADTVVITSIQVSGLDAAGLPPAIDTIAAGDSAMASATIGDSVGDPGTPTTLTVTGTFRNGTFTTSARVILP